MSDYPIIRANSARRAHFDSIRVTSHRSLSSRHSPLIERVEHFKRTDKRRILVRYSNSNFPNAFFGFFKPRIYLWMNRVNFTSASLFRPDSSRPFDFGSWPIYTKIRIAARNRGRGNRVSCDSRRYLDIYTIEKTFLSR